MQMQRGTCGRAIVNDRPAALFEVIDRLQVGLNALSGQCSAGQCSGGRPKKQAG